MEGVLDQDRPRIEENRLDVEDDEEHGGEIEADRESAAGGLGRDNPALVRQTLGLGRMAGAEEGDA